MGRDEDYHHRDRHRHYDHRRSHQGSDRSRHSHHHYHHQHQHHRSSSGHRHSPRTSDPITHHQPSPFQSMNPFPMGPPIMVNPDSHHFNNNLYQQMAMMQQQQQQQQYIPNIDFNHIALNQNMPSVPPNYHGQSWNVPEKQILDPMVQSVAPRNQVISSDRDILDRLQLPPEKITETGIIPDKAYYELPAGLMVPLVPVGQKQYKPINPSDLRLPFPKFPDETFLKTIDSYYKPDFRTRDNDGWDREFIKKITS